MPKERIEIDKKTFDSAVKSFGIEPKSKAYLELVESEKNYIHNLQSLSKSQIKKIKSALKKEKNERLTKLLNRIFDTWEKLQNGHHQLFKVLLCKRETREAQEGF